MRIGKNTSSVVSAEGISSFNRRKTQKNIMSYLMISPQLIGFFVFTVYPIIWVIIKSFHYYTGVDINMRFVGFDNYIELFKTDTAYIKAWFTTLQFAVIKLPVELSLAMLLAVFLNRELKGRGFFRALFFMPNIISLAIIGLIFSNMFDYFGFINGILSKFGILTQGYDWFATKWSAMTVLVIGSIWNCFGLNMLYFLAGLQNISEDLYEAAYLDGATGIQSFFKITLPLMAPILQIVLLLSINGTLQTSDYVLVMTNGAPGGQTNFIQTYLIKKFMPGFADSASINIGYGCATYIITSIINTLIAVGYFKLNLATSCKTYIKAVI